MHRTPRVSVLLPVYNGEKTLRDTLKSILEQSYADFELLIGIDGSTDKSEAIILACNDDRIKIYKHDQNLGLARNLNFLINCASSATEFFAMAEQDDIYVRDRLMWQVMYMDNHPTVGLTSGIAEFVSENNRVLFPGILVNNTQFPQGKTMFKYLYINQLKVVNTCMLWRKSVHIDNGLSFLNTYGNFNIDWNFMLRFVLVSEVHGLHKVLVTMNREKTNKSVTSDKTLQHKASRQLLDDYRKEYPNLIDDELYKNALKNHRKIELGHNTKLGILFKGVSYAIRYQDSYFIKYIYKRFKSYLNGRH